MKAAIYRGIGRIGLQQVERLPPPPGYVTIDTRQTGICGSDLHVYRGHWPQPKSLALGHETSGVVVELGEGVTGFEPGDRVAIECFSHCGRCRFCRSGHYNHCRERQWVSQDTHGGFAEFTTAHASALFRLPANLSFEEGALVEPLAVGCRAVGQAGATWRDRVAILGGGTIGQFCLAAAKAANVRETWITVKYPHQARMARSLGADHVFVLGESDLEDWVSGLDQGPRADAVIETVGGGGNFDLALRIVRPRGTVVLVAGYPEPVKVDLGRVLESEAVVTGSHCYASTGLDTDFGAAIDLMASGRVDATRLVTHRFPLEAVEEAFRVAANKSSGSIKVHLCQ
ncbi:MAG: alcohol dehydrogenase catalytic domain-containing protein [Candidatus Aminicenantes bacterium]|nr:alcohol dehydrogenase catalytic domain-containing protein [Candidatus Aminicenantes bacterium]